MYYVCIIYYMWQNNVSKSPSLYTSTTNNRITLHPLLINGSAAASIRSVFKRLSFCPKQTAQKPLGG